MLAVSVGGCLILRHRSRTRLVIRRQLAPRSQRTRGSDTNEASPATTKAMTRLRRIVGHIAGRLLKSG
jgi:hypothetical protein